MSLGFAAAKADMGKFKTADGLERDARRRGADDPESDEHRHRSARPRLGGRGGELSRAASRRGAQLREAGDRVVILEDTNGDGVADKETTFYQSKELTNPLGICVLPQEKGTQVIVSAAPNVWLLTDADGDDQAEKAEIIAKVKGNWDHDHQVHAFVFGADGKFYFNFGNESRDLLDGDGNFFTDLSGRRTAADGKPYRQGLVFRADLVDGKLTNIETLGSNFRNNYEVTVDSFGTMWQSDNDDDGNKGVRINYVMEFGNYGYTDEMTGAGWRTKRTNLEKEIPLQHWHQNDPGVVPNLLQTGSGSPTGILVNEGAALGPQFENQLIHCDAGPRTVRAYPVQPRRRGLQGRRWSIFSRARIRGIGPPTWRSRPMVRSSSPTGTTPGVGGHNMADHEKGEIRGRIYRVAPSGGKVVRADARLQHRGGLRRRAAVAESRDDVCRVAEAREAWARSRKPDLAKLWKDGENPRHRARALGAARARLPQGNRLSAPGPGRRATATCASPPSASPPTLATHRGTRHHAARGRSRAHGQAAARPESAGAPADRALAARREGHRTSSGRRSRSSTTARIAGISKRSASAPTGNEDACFDAWLAAVGDKWNTPAGRDIIWRLRSAKSRGLPREDSSQDKTVADADKPRYLRAFDFLPEAPEKTKALIELASLGDGTNAIAAEALDALEERGPATPIPA